MASSKSPAAAVEDGKGPAVSARCTVVAPSPAARPCRAGAAGGPGRGDVQRPAALTCCGRARPVRHPPAARRRCLAPRGSHRDGDLRGMAPRPVRAEEQRFTGCCAGGGSCEGWSEVRVEGSHRSMAPAWRSTFRCSPSSSNRIGIASWAARTASCRARGSSSPITAAPPRSAALPKICCVRSSSSGSWPRIGRRVECGCPGCRGQR